MRTTVKIGMRGDKLVEVRKLQLPGTSIGTEGAWEGFTGKEEIVRSGVVGLKDGQAAQVSTDGK